MLKQKISIHPNSMKHQPTSYIIATCRNHTAESYFWHGETTLTIPEKVAAYGSITPQVGARRKLYRIGHGPTDGRKDYDGYTGYHFKEWFDKPGKYPYDDIRYALKEAIQMDADMSIVVNFGSGTAQEAYELAEYLYNPDFWLRKQYPISTIADCTEQEWDNIHKYRIKFFEIGQEITWDVVIGSETKARTAKLYAQNALAFVENILRVTGRYDQAAIKIGMVGSTNSTWSTSYWSSDIKTNILDIMSVMRDKMDFFVFHGYPSWPLYEAYPGPDGFDPKKDPIKVLAQNTYNNQLIENLIVKAIEEGRNKFGIKKPITIGNTEYHAELGKQVTATMDYRHAGLQAIYTADTMISALKQNLEMAVNFCFSHASWPGAPDLIDDLFFHPDRNNPKKPVFYVHEFMAENLSGAGMVIDHTEIHPYRYDVEYDYEVSKSGEIFWEIRDKRINQLSVVATKDHNGKIIVLIANIMENNAPTTEGLSINLDPGIAYERAIMKTLAFDTYFDETCEKTETDVTAYVNNLWIKKASINAIIFTPKKAI